MRVEEVFSKFIKKYPKLDLKLASGGLSDIKGPNTSDVDISFFCKNLEGSKNIFHDAVSIDKDKNKKWIVYTYFLYGREVNVYCTNDKKLANRGLIHRRNEIMLNNYPLLAAQAIILKKNGHGTEPAWAKVLELPGDPYEAMLASEKSLEKKAKKINELYKKLISNLAKQ